MIITIIAHLNRHCYCCSFQNQAKSEIDRSKYQPAIHQFLRLFIVQNEKKICF